MKLNIIYAGPFTTVQDPGRFGFERFGVPQSGAMDWLSLHAANRLVGNPAGEAGLEFLFEGPHLVAEGNCLIAVTGRGYSLVINGRQIGSWRCALAREGEMIQIYPTGTAGWGYMAVSGGIDVPQVMGSRSTYLRGGFGGLQGRVLLDGDYLQVGVTAMEANWVNLAGRAIPAALRPEFKDEMMVPVVIGPQADIFGEEGLNVFLTSEYQVNSTSDRMGYRLSGLVIPRTDQSELVSEGIAHGSVQVPSDGQPIVLMSDRPTTGGYHKIATVTMAGLSSFAQVMPGSGRVWFRSVSIEEAQQSYRERVRMIDTGIQDDED